MTQGKQKRYTNSYESIVAKQLIDALEQNKAACIVTAATPGGFCLTKDIRKKLGAQYIDVGIAEEHATTLLAGIAYNGGTPILPIYSTFYNVPMIKLLMTYVLIIAMH